MYFSLSPLLLPFPPHVRYSTSLGAPKGTYLIGSHNPTCGSALGPENIDRILLANVEYKENNTFDIAYS